MFSSSRLALCILLSLQMHCGSAETYQKLPYEGKSFVVGEALVTLQGAGLHTLDSIDISEQRVEKIRDLSPDTILLQILWNSELRTQTTEEREQKTLEIIERLKAHPDVKHIKENSLFDFSAPPNDPLYSLQNWNFSSINLPDAWSISTGSNNVKIAILDTGTMPHPDLDSQWLAGYDAGEDDFDPSSDGSYQHGIHTAGVIAAVTNNAKGVVGICWNCKLLPVKITQRVAPNIPNEAAIISGLLWAARNGANIVNMSFESPQPCTMHDTLQQTINQLVEQGITVVASAGNTGGTVTNVSPASCAGVIAVAASDQTGKLATYSARGSRIALTAPGGGNLYGGFVDCVHGGDDSGSGTDAILSTWVTATGDACYRYLGGTSNSAPHVAGVAGLLLSKNPSWTAKDVLCVLKQSATPIPGCTSCGKGMINATAALDTIFSGCFE